MVGSLKQGVCPEGDVYRILLLDDDPDDLELMADMLRTQSRVRFHLVPVHTVEEADWHMRHNSFDLLIVDYRLAGAFGERQGTDFIKNWKELGLRTPVLLVSGQPRVLLDRDILTMISNGSLKFLNKRDMDPGTLLDGVFSLVCRPIRVLIVDDCQQQAQALEDVLRADEFHRFRTWVKHSVPDALAHARANSVDVIVTKHALPPHRGLDLIRPVIEEDRVPNTSFVLLAEGKLLVDDYVALRMMGRRQIEFQSPDAIADGSIIPSIVRAYNDNLAARYYCRKDQVAADKAAAGTG